LRNVPKHHESIRIIECILIEKISGYYYYSSARYTELFSGLQFNNAQLLAWFL